jgi:hypothetical protein
VRLLAGRLPIVISQYGRRRDADEQWRARIIVAVLIDGDNSRCQFAVHEAGEQGEVTVIVQDERLERPTLSPEDTPMGLVALGRDDQALDLPRQMVGVANRPARAVGQGLEDKGALVAVVPPERYCSFQKSDVSVLKTPRHRAPPQKQETVMPSLTIEMVQPVRRADGWPRAEGKSWA